ncbi:MAG: HIT domain-containing protein [Verrucomicrobiota bacterium JB022]|nr:HIT domain-containing protein [Verrucomicrobiota bacterium JB022]
MDILQSYWRMEYVTAAPKEKSRNDRLFEDLPKQDDREALIVHRGEYHYLILNRFPYNPGHLMVIPYRAVADLKELNQPERAEMMDLIIYGQELLTRTMKPDGFNVGFNLGKSAGAGIPHHLHAHIVPRWDGDTNFLPVIGKTRTLPQALEQTWERLKANL